MLLSQPLLLSNRGRGVSQVCPGFSVSPRGGLQACHSLPHSQESVAGTGCRGAAQLPYSGHKMAASSGRRGQTWRPPRRAQDGASAAEAPRRPCGGASFPGTWEALRLRLVSGMRFAERELRRRGWRAGKGLGKQEDGIAEAIKVKVKCGTAGVGHSSSEELTFHWWDHVYNSVAANINVEAGQDGAKVEKISEQSRAITNKKPRKAQENKNMLYGRFVKAATLTGSREEPLKPPPSSDSSDEDEKLDLSTARRLTDEELVQVCGGRTAHKGARHGLMMSAKLARLEAQEKAFLASRCQQMGGKEEAPSSSQEERQRKGKKRRKKQERELEGLEDPSRDQEEEEGPKKRKKKKRKQREENGRGE